MKKSKDIPLIDFGKDGIPATEILDFLKSIEKNTKEKTNNN